MDASNFVWDEFFWTTTIRFPRPQPTTDLRPGSPGQTATDMVSLRYAPEGRGEAPLDDTEIASVKWTIENLPLLSSALYPAAFSYYQSLLHTGIDGLHSEDMQIFRSVYEFEQWIRIQFINVHQVSRDGKPYVGFECECPWDEEHGLGVLMHGTRVLKIGGADTAILLWIAKQDIKAGPPQ